jgi:hypothetical protein
MRRHEGAFYFDGAPARQAEFDAAIDSLLSATTFVAFGAGVRKTAFHEQFVSTGIDPYLPSDCYTVAIAMLLERFMDFIATYPEVAIGRVSLESIGPREDAYHQLEYARLLVDGTQWVPATHFQHCLEPGVRFLPKAGSHPLELADMLARDLYEWVESDCMTAPKHWALFSARTYCRGDGSLGKFGIKVFPDSDIRELIAAHRERRHSADN